MKQVMAGVGGVALALLVAGCGQSQENARAPAAPPPLPVALVMVQSRVITETTSYVGTLESRRSVSLQPRVDGTIAQILVRAGDRVIQGQPLVEIDQLQQQASVSGFAAATQERQADLESARQLLRSYEADRRSNVANQKFQQQRYERYLALQKVGAISQLQLEEYRNSLDSAAAALESINARIQAQQATVTSAQKALVKAQADGRAQTVELDYYRIRAPFAGEVGDIPVKVGDYVSPATALLRLTQNQPLELNISIPNEKADRLSKGMSVELVDAQGAPLGEGQVFFIAANSNNQDQSVLVKAEYANPRGQLRAGQYVQAKVIWGKQTGVLIPNTAITRLADQNFIYVAETKEKGLVARQRQVQLGDLQGNQYQVFSGLKPGERVVTSGLLKLVDGAPIVPSS